ncbi:hypothetical protein MKX07_008435 [Trichoderma sp. CBMAI-0711]|nr:hypothetical protein MKX07_008435 [Trichoderma sp. CBMAI-0711]
MAPKRQLPIHHKGDRREIAETPAPEASSSSPTSPPAQRAKLEEERPNSLKNFPGNMRWVDGQTNENMAGITSIACVAVSMLEHLTAGNARPVDLEETKSFLKHVGGAETVKKFSEKVYNTVGGFETKAAPEESVFKGFDVNKAWEANPNDDNDDNDDAAAGESAPIGGREASIELGTTPTPMDMTTTTAATTTTTAGREREGSAELGAAAEVSTAATPVVIESDLETSDEPVDSSPLAQKTARAAAEKIVTSKYFRGGAGAGGASAKA